MNNQILAGVILIAIVVFFLGTYSPMGSGIWGGGMMDHQVEMHEMNEHRDEFLSHRDAMVEEMIKHGAYRCCLETPCTYCIEKTPGHGTDATCDCLADIVAGKHPCGECIGEILEGHGNPYLSEYFAVAIAEEVGEQYTDTLRQIISDKYGISVEEQL